MILYHFTTLPALFRTGEPITTGRHNLAVQWPDGIMPTSDAFPYMRPAVWLTNAPEPGCADAPGDCVRICVKIPTTDHRLVPYRKAFPKMLAKANRETGKQVTLQQFFEDRPRDFLQKASAAWWLYYDWVTLGKIIGCEIIDGRRPWWLVVAA